MITYQRINTELNDQSLATYVPTPEGLAMGNAPNWALLLDSDYITTTEMRNRVVKNSLVPLHYSTATVTTKTVGSNTLFTAASQLVLRASPSVALSQTEWSVVFVAQPKARTGGVKHGIVTGISSSTALGKTINVGFSAGTGAIIVSKYGSVNDTDRLLSYSKTTGAYSDALNVFVVTFSTTNGLAIRVNGVLKASNTDAASKAACTAQMGEGEWAAFNSAEGDYGMLGILNSDLSDAKNKPYLDSIEQFLLNKYSVVA